MWLTVEKVREVLQSKHVELIAFCPPPAQYGTAESLALALGKGCPSEGSAASAGISGPPAKGTGKSEASTAGLVFASKVESASGVGVVHIRWSGGGAAKLAPPAEEDPGEQSEQRPAALFMKWTTVEGIRAQYLTHHDAGASERKIGCRIAAHQSETVVYADIASKLEDRGVRLPKAIAVECVPGERFALFLEYKPGYTVNQRLDHHGLLAAATALASLHGACFGDAGLLESFQQSGCFWTAEKMDVVRPTELGDAWVGFAERFAGVGGGVDGRVPAAARVLDSVHSAVSAHFAEDSLARQTMCHGDFKAANLLWGSGGGGGGGDDGRPVIIDFEWAGPGAAAQDLAYLLLSSSPVGTDWDAACHSYHSCLTPVIRKSYPLAALRSDLDLAALEVFRWLLSARWKTVTPAAMDADSASYGRVLPNRSIPHAVELSRRAVEILETHPFIQTTLALNGI